MQNPGTLHPVHTPTVQLERLFAEHLVEVFAKLDLLQLSGSTKERTAYSLIEALLGTAALQPGGTIVESTSGNLGIALARQSVVRGIRFVAVVDENANQSSLDIMRAFGAIIDIVPTPADGNKLAARRLRVKELLAAHPGSVTTNQYGSPANPAAHSSSTMPEFMAAVDGRLDILFVATSTTGTLLGCQQYLREHHPETILAAVDAVGSVLFDGEAGVRHLPGLGAGIMPDLAQHTHPDEVFRIEEIDMVRGCRRLARDEGILAGASTGAIVSAMAQRVGQLEPGSRVGFLVHDSGVPYLQTIYNDTWVRNTLGEDLEPRLRGAEPSSITA